MKLKLYTAPIPTAQPTKPPSPNILDSRFKYIPASKIDIVKRFRAMGWVPPSEKKGDV